ncbi:MAG: efflux RND transporter periplasmic adaptor subunit [Neisseriaceae bacterium]|nr:efflux RND transporter periplasmic adaptor subunit [Neisseriaceae bacterium]
MKKIKMKWVLAILLVAALAFGVYTFFFKSDDQVNYLTETVRTGNISRTVNATGEVAPAQLVSVGAQASGQVQKLHVVLGQEIKKGDLIAEIDSTTQRNNLANDKAKLETYQAQLVSAQISLDAATIQHQREVKLMANDATSRESLENASTALASAKARVAEVRSLIKQMQIAVNTSETNLGYTRIVAPFDGTVVAVIVEEGQTVNANQTTPNIVQLADLNKMEIKLQIAEGDVTKVKPGMKVSYTILSEPDEVFHTDLASIDPGYTTLSDGKYTDSSSNEAAVYYYGKLLVPNEDRKLSIGMTTQNVIEVASVQKVLIVPSIVIRKQKGKSMVSVLGEDSQVTEREVKTGLSDNMNTQILSGLKEGEKVVASQLAAGEKPGNGQGPRAGAGRGMRI